MSGSNPALPQARRAGQAGTVRPARPARRTTARSSSRACPKATRGRSASTARLPSTRTSAPWPRDYWHDHAASWDLLAFEYIPDAMHADYRPGSPDLDQVTTA